MLVEQSCFYETGRRSDEAHILSVSRGAKCLRDKATINEPDRRALGAFEADRAPRTLAMRVWRPVWESNPFSPP